MKSLRSLFAGLIFCLSGCCGPKVEDYANNTPVLDAREYFNGDLEAWGAFFKRDGTADPRFLATLHGEFEGNEGTLKEEFTYDDGRKQQRLWHLRFSDDHHFTGTAGDVVGTMHGKQYGNAINLKYTLRLATNGNTYDMAMDDWLYLIDDTHLINRTTMSKFGIKVGELVIGFHKP